MSRGSEWEADKEMDRMHADEAEAEAMRKFAEESTDDNLATAFHDMSLPEWQSAMRGLWEGDDAAWLAAREPLIRALITLAEPDFRRCQDGLRAYGDHDA